MLQFARAGPASLQVDDGCLLPGARFPHIPNSVRVWTSSDCETLKTPYLPKCRSMHWTCKHRGVCYDSGYQRSNPVVVSVLVEMTLVLV